jgi:sterol desaturase/sphingolipid hydroxylase (fatty acid hydroxylase superfamily)
MAWLLAYLEIAGPFLAGIAVFVAAELLVPQSQSGWTGRLQGVTFLTISFAGAATATILFNGLSAALHLRPLWSVAAPWPIGVFLAPLIGDFFYYWFHRAQHSVPALWRLHSVHHSIRDLSAANSYHHWTEELVRVLFVTAPAALLVRIDYAAVPLIAGAMALHDALPIYS